jgi:cytoskeletal protein RodZ
MKEIGAALKEQRENTGLSLEEVASDLKLRPSQIENIEAGNMDAFKDVFYLKYFIKEYAKYLGLSYDALIDEFNEYIFDYTSKISLEDIKKAAKKESKKDKKQKRIASPYTIERRKRINFKIGLVIFLSIIALLLGIFIIKTVVDTNNDQPIDNVIR